MVGPARSRRLRGLKLASLVSCLLLAIPPSGFAAVPVNGASLESLPEYHTEFPHTPTAAPVSVAVTKRLLWEAPLLTPDEVERKETALHIEIMTKPDAVEGPMAFVQKRTPEWKLRVSSDWPEWPD